MSAVLSYEQKKKKYINVFYGLVALTLIELVIVALPFKGAFMSIAIAVFSSAKAVVVGYYYMHLEHETKMLKIVACLPIIAFGYAFFLVKDLSHRPMSPYLYEPARVYPEAHGEGHNDPFGVEKASEEAQAQLEASAQVTGDGAAVPAKAEGGAAAPAAPTAPSGGGASDDVSNWR